MKISLKTWRKEHLSPDSIGCYWRVWIFIRNVAYRNVLPGSELSEDDESVSDDEEFALVPAETQEVVDCLKF
jgi:hypothetical protein